MNESTVKKALAIIASDVRYSIDQSQQNAILDFFLKEDQELFVDPRLIIAMSDAFDIEQDPRSTTALAGTGKWWGSSGAINANDNFELARLRAVHDEARVSLASQLPGMILGLPVSDESGFYIVQENFVAAAKDLQIDRRQVGRMFRTGRKQLSLLQFTGSGELFVSAYGDIVAREIAEGEPLLVALNSLVGFRDSVSMEWYRAPKDNGFASAVFEINPFLQLTGPGTVLIKSRFVL
jgi:uncharacterized protein (AIM24 family)